MTDHTAPELKPCPFCGEADQETLMIQHMPGTIRHPAYRVCCDNCGASTGYSDRGDHIAAWNTRAEVDALVAAAYAKGMVDGAKSCGHLTNKHDALHLFEALTDFVLEHGDAHTEAAVRRALEAAARIKCDADFVAVWGPYEHGVNDMQTAIRDLANDPAQFIGGGE